MVVAASEDRPNIGEAQAYQTKILRVKASHARIPNRKIHRADYHADDPALLEPRVDRLALEREHTEDTLVHPAQRLAADEALQRLDAERELSDRERALAPEAAAPQALEVGGFGVLGAVDDAEGLAAAGLERRLGEAAAAASDELERLDDHTLAPALRELGPPRAAGALALGLGGVDDEVGGGVEQLVAGAELRERLHVPEMILVDVDGSLTG